MNGIQALGSATPIASLQSFGAARAPSQGPAALFSGGSNEAAAITNDEGQSLIDFKDELQAAVASALEESGGTDPRSAVRSAVESTLSENGFDVEEVRSAMESRIGEMRRGGGPAAMFGGASAFGAAGGAESASQSMIDQFLSQLRAGSNLDFVG
ncbi:MAG: hypothetical protein AAFU73_10335 [Planctomycetota bacterium]